MRPLVSPILEPPCSSELHADSIGPAADRQERRRWLLRVLGSAVVGPWTASVTVSSVALAHATRDESWVLRGERFWANGLLKLWNVTLDVQGVELWPASSPACIVMSNHGSLADVPILFSALPVVPGFLAKRELARIPFLSMALRAGGHVLVERTSRASATQAVKAAARKVREGQTIALFPEGTRGDGAALGPFKRGGFVLAKLAEVPVVPVAIRGSHAVLPPGSLLPNAGHVSVHFGKPILASDTKSLTSEQLLALVRARIAELSGLCPGEPPNTTSLGPVAHAVRLGQEH